MDGGVGDRTRRKRTFPPLITASTWNTAWGSCFSAVLAAHGKAHTKDGTLVPPLTNGEAVQLVFAWRTVGMNRGLALWGQYAATAYGWSHDNEILDLTERQRDARYPIQIAGELWLALQKVALTADNEKYDGGTTGGGRARLEFDHTFDDSTVQGAVAAELKADGSDVTFRMKGGIVAPKPKPKKQPTPLWMVLVGFYVGYRIIKNVTGGPRYAGD